MDKPVLVTFQYSAKKTENKTNDKKMKIFSWSGNYQTSLLLRIMILFYQKITSTRNLK